jgi:hypothetical protein
VPPYASLPSAKADQLVADPAVGKCAGVTIGIRPRGLEQSRAQADFPWRRID